MTSLAAPANARRRSRSDHPIPTAVVGAGVFLLVLTALSAISWDSVTEPRFEHVDFAANSLLIDKAMTLDLLHGNYSRTGFYHPGPALLYVQAGSQFMFHDLTGLVPTPYNAHLLGILILNSTLLGIVAAISYRASGSAMSALALIVAAFAYSLLLNNPGLGGLLSSTWMPHVYVWPFLLLLVSSGSIMAGKGEDLWAVALAGGLLVHGHVAFIMPVLVIGIAASLAWGTRHRREWFRAIPRSSQVATIVVTAAFGLPIILQLITNFPGQFDDYLRYVRDTQLPPRDLGTVTRFLAQYWAFGSVWWIFIPLLVISTVLVAHFEVSTGRRRFHQALVTTGVLASVTTFLYGYTGVDDFSYTYLALFYVAVPIVFWAVLVTGLLERWKTAGAPLRIAAMVALITAWLFIVAQPGSGSLYQGSDVGTAYSMMRVHLASEEPVVLSFADHGDWAVAVGVFEQLRRNGHPSCAKVAPGILEVLFTAENVCGAQVGDHRVELQITTRSNPPESAKRLLFDGETYDIWILDD